MCIKFKLLNSNIANYVRCFAEGTGVEFLRTVTVNGYVVNIKHNFVFDARDERFGREDLKLTSGKIYSLDINKYLPTLPNTNFVILKAC